MVRKKVPILSPVLVVFASSLAGAGGSVALAQTTAQPSPADAPAQSLPEPPMQPAPPPPPPAVPPGPGPRGPGQVLDLERPRHANHVGLSKRDSQGFVGVRLLGGGIWSQLSSYGAMGVGLDLMYFTKPGSWFAVGICGQLLPAIAGTYSTGLGSPPDNRFDISALITGRAHLGDPSERLSPYAVAAVGITISTLSPNQSQNQSQNPGQNQKLPDEDGYFLEAQGGLGLACRLTSHFELDLDLRGVGRILFHDSNAATAQMNSMSVGPPSPVGPVTLGHGGGVLGNLGVGATF